MGLEDQKDLRARFRKFLILTNERKKMSKTTLRKRISLVTVTALTAGVLSVAAAPVASANIAGSTNAVTTSGSFNVAVVASTTGAASSVASATGVANTSTSLGLVYKDASSTTAQTATMLSTGALALYAGASTATKMAMVATGGKFSSAKAVTTALADSTAGAIAADLKSVFWNSNVGAGTGVAVIWTPGAVGTYTLQLYREDGVNTAPSAAVPAGGTLTGQILVTVVATSAAGEMSSVYTLCNTGTSATAATGTDASGSTNLANGSTGYINFTIKDAYQSEITAGDPLVATATNGAIVNIGTSIGTATGSTSVSVADNSSTIAVAQATANAPVTTTVTLTFKGKTVCSKTITIQGEVAKMVVTPAATQTTGASTFTDTTYGVSGGNFRAQLFDSAGNLVVPVDGTARFAQVSSSVEGASVTALAMSTAASAIASSDATGLWPSVNSLGTVTCSTTAGEDTSLNMSYQNPSGSSVVSNSFSARCAGLPYTYKASLDKASYKQGEVATLTVQFLDIKGNKAATASTGTAGTVTFNQMSRVGGDPTASKKTDINGVITHTFTVGNSGTFTPGTYIGLVSYSDYNTFGSVQQVNYSITETTPSVTNADVLKSIVALIASINKQIQALQKLILKR
jgi:hypothetical protein